jgi:hypothetical protein
LVISFRGDFGVFSQSIETDLVVFGVTVPDAVVILLEGVINEVMARGAIFGVTGRAAALDNDRPSNWYVSMRGMLNRV